MANVERLLRLAEHLDTVPTEQFDMSIWKDDYECSTVACAIGHGCNVPEFQEAGLHLERVCDDAEWGPSFEGLDGFEAVAVFFGTSVDQAKNLFGYSWTNGYKTPGEIAKRIRRFVERQVPAGAAR